jgi:(2Fe-2S) ferredoxin
MPRPDLQILVCTNERAADTGKACCLDRLGLEVYRALKDAIRSRHVRDRVLATRTGCLRHCSQGVTVAVWPQNHWYRAVTPEDVEEILDAALEGREVLRLRTPDLDWE